MTECAKQDQRCDADRRRGAGLRQGRGARSPRSLFPPLILASLLSLASISLFAQDLIVNPALSAVSLTRNEALLYFTGRLQLWPNGLPVKVFVLPDADHLHRDFVKSVLGLYPYQLRRVWDRQLYSGTGQAPVLVSSELEMIERVAATEGGIGYAHVGVEDDRVRRLEVH